MRPPHAVEMPKQDEYSTVRLFFKLGAAANIVGTAVVTKGFTDVAALTAQQPTVFSLPSVVLILLWGLAYLSAASKFEHMPLMCLVFCLEKVRGATVGDTAPRVLTCRRLPCASNACGPPRTLQALYTGLWVSWITANGHMLSDLIASDFLTGFFFAAYGLNDGLFALVFAHAAFTAWSRRVAKAARD